MNPDQFQDLYKLLRGSRAATDVLDARALFMENKLPLAQSKILAAREANAECRSRLLKLPAEKQVDAKSRDADRRRASSDFFDALRIGILTRGGIFDRVLAVGTRC
jgi:hypothetical protein